MAWAYSESVKDHFMNPRNVLTDEKIEDFDARGVEGNIKCGDEMMVFLKIDAKNQTITDCKWKTFGCASAIASMSVLSEMVKGMTLEKAYQLTPKDVLNTLEGLPDNKIHCSVLGDKALRMAIDDYYQKNGIENNLKETDDKILCQCMNLTEKDIKSAIDDGAKTYEELQSKTKCGTVCGQCKEDIIIFLESELH